MFFQHGGNNQIDGADQVDFTEFAYAANVIAISVNYRLGALGFNPLRAIKGEDPAQASGNFAIPMPSAAFPGEGQYCKLWGKSRKYYDRRFLFGRT